MPDDIYNNNSSKYESDLQSFTYSVNRKEQIVVASEERINKLIKKLIKERNMDEIHARKEAAKIEATLQQNSYKKLAFQSRESYLKQKAYEMELAKQKLEDQKILTKKFETDEKKRRSLLREYTKQQKLLDDERLKSEKEIAKVQEISRKVSEEAEKKYGSRQGWRGKVEEAKAKVASTQKSFQEALSKESQFRAQAEYEKYLYGSTTKSTADSLLRAESDTAKAKAEYDQAESTSKIVSSVDSMASQVVNNLIKINESINSEVEKAVYAIKEYQPQVLARLQGTNKRYDDILNVLKMNLSFSPFVSYQETLENVIKLVDLGIAYNIEERAFLGTIAEDIATTFDAFDSNLLRLIRLQQADTTAARMGMEAYLTQFLNKMFSDTSYLNNVYDAVSAALIDSQSMSPYYEASSSEYILQKWLGSLYSLGFSDTAIQRIAKGLNMLLTGDVQGLANDTAMQTLLAMSASRISTVNFADAMLEGLNSSQINDLMLSMVTYLQEIAKNSDTRVVRSAFGDIFDMSMSDLAAIQNLTLQDLNDIYASTLSYTEAYKEAGKQLMAVPSRLALSDMINNVLQNAMFMVGTEIAKNPAEYLLYTIADMIEDATGGIHLPQIELKALGFGGTLDLSMFTFEGLTKESIVLQELTNKTLPLLFTSIATLGGISTDILGVWRAEQLTSRGEGTLLNVSGTAQGISASDYFAQSNSELQKSLEALNSIKEIFGAEEQSPTSLTDIYDLIDDRYGVEESILSVVEDISGALGNVVPQYASGTRNAISGFAIVGENGPELVKLSGGESIFNSDETSSLISLLSSASLYEASAVNDVKISDIDSNFENKLKQILIQVLANKSSETSTLFKSDDDEDDFKELIKKMLNGDMSVHVNNSNLDEFLQKSTYNF